MAHEHGMPILEQGAMRIGAAPAWAKWLLFAGLLGYEVVVWRRAGGDARDPAGGACLAAVTAVLVFSPLISEQYAAWLLPWAAVAFEGARAERKVAAIAASAIVLTGLLGLFYLMPFDWAALAQRWTILARNVALVLLLIVWFRATAPTRRAPPSWRTSVSTRGSSLVEVRGSEAPTCATADPRGRVPPLGWPATCASKQRGIASMCGDNSRPRWKPGENAGNLSAQQKGLRDRARRDHLADEAHPTWWQRLLRQLKHETPETGT